MPERASEERREQCSGVVGTMKALPSIARSAPRRMSKGSLPLVLSAYDQGRCQRSSPLSNRALCQDPHGSVGAVPLRRAVNRFSTLCATRAPIFPLLPTPLNGLLCNIGDAKQPHHASIERFHPSIRTGDAARCRSSACPPWAFATSGQKRSRLRRSLHSPQTLPSHGFVGC